MERVKLVWTLILLEVHTSISSLFREGIFDYHWSWRLYPEKNVRYFCNKYGSIMNAKSVLL